MANISALLAIISVVLACGDARPPGGSSISPASTRDEKGTLQKLSGVWFANCGLMGEIPSTISADFHRDLRFSMTITYYADSNCKEEVARLSFQRHFMPGNDSKNVRGAIEVDFSAGTLEEMLSLSDPATSIPDLCQDGKKLLANNRCEVMQSYQITSVVEDKMYLGELTAAETGTTPGQRPTRLSERFFGQMAVSH